MHKIIDSRLLGVFRDADYEPETTIGLAQKSDTLGRHAVKVRMLGMADPHIIMLKLAAIWGMVG